MIFRNFDLNKYNSDIKVQFKIDENDRVLLIDISGNYRDGSEGNVDADFIFAKISGYFLVVEPVIVVIDISKLTYTWGNSFLKILNFVKLIGRDEYEKNIEQLVIISEENKPYIYSLIRYENEDLPHNFFLDLRIALDEAESRLDYI
ncbi:MAG: hypothetical protein AAF734_02005 [Bacteroidota bacterium]